MATASPEDIRRAVQAERDADIVEGIDARLRRIEERLIVEPDADAKPPATGAAETQADPA